ncbi:hypothetical protein GCM10027406_21890 [Leifsonia lichenia]
MERPHRQVVRARDHRRGQLRASQVLVDVCADGGQRIHGFRWVGEQGGGEHPGRPAEKLLRGGSGEVVDMVGEMPREGHDDRQQRAVGSAEDDIRPRDGVVEAGDRAAREVHDERIRVVVLPDALLSPVHESDHVAAARRHRAPTVRQFGAAPQLDEHRQLPRLALRAQLPELAWCTG